MLMTNFLQKRKSVRNFKKDTVPRDSLENIKLLMDELDQEEGEINFSLYENGKIVAEGLRGKAGYSGVMIEAPHYIALDITNDKPLNILKGGYCLEKLNTKIVDLDLDTCWITVDDVDAETKKAIFGENGVGIDYLIAIGYGQKKKLFDPEVTSSRLNVDEIVFADTLGNPISIETLENYGVFDVFSSVRYAPSHKNFQPWRFVLKGSEVHAYMVKSDEDSRSLIDMGVILFYMEEMLKIMGIEKKWTIDLKDDGKYYYIGSFTL